MGFIKRVFQLATYGPAASVGAFFWTTRKSTFVPMTPSDPIFKSSFLRAQNPQQNPTSYDLCIRRVPLSEINPSLLEKKGRLTEAFCAGIWSGWGYALQRAHHERNAPREETTNHLWTREELRSSSYEVGTLITDHFEVLEKTPERIVVRCGDTPRNQGVRASDGLFEMSVVVNPDEGVAEFGLKSCFFQGLGKAETAPMPSPILWLHKQYTKLWMETALVNVCR
ncbi:hypothetical protein EYZ11_006400 [Aspergillus tanneri]|uniref:Uncharacterized protein n=1 Tax=Aspergillus tanneri TaxID=1220188 RepID=A0A4S3JLD7_9EURO|nr:uncharacterized protein ATNIH1004_008133 [Aspergillus tanneri]KAA8643937.1 hypothetical protein ATNIH1004_008133 [Aspergillus tanneri]THC94111.1 hypothetical protein EYZ11_006400 [Aspergillus tanneri]